MYAIIKVELPIIKNIKIKHVIGSVREDDKEICYSLRVETIKIIRGRNNAKSTPTEAKRLQRASAK